MMAAFIAETVRRNNKAVANMVFADASLHHSELMHKVLLAMACMQFAEVHAERRKPLHHYCPERLVADTSHTPVLKGLARAI